MTIEFDPDLRDDVSRFLARYELENVAEIPVTVIAETNFPRSNKISEHKALSAIVARLLRMERFLMKRTRTLGRLDEQDLVRATLDHEICSWWESIGRPTLIALGFLDCRERLVRLAQLAEEARVLRAIDRLIARRSDESLSDLGEMQALVSWLNQEINDAANLTRQIPEMPCDLLPQPAWQLFLSLRQQQDRLGVALMDLGLRGESLEFLDAYIAKSEALKHALGHLSEYEGLLDFCDPVDDVLSEAMAVKYSWVRKALEMGVEHLNVNQELLADVFLFDELIQSSIDEAFRLTDRNNALWDFIGTDFFRPDDWKANREALRPLLLKQPQNISPVLRGYLSELAHAFVLGHWASVQALSRALLEQSIKVNCKRLAIDLNYTGGTKKKSLEALIDEVAEQLPSIKGSMHAVRDYGNKVLHSDPRRTENEQVQAARRLWMREDAVVSLESLYAVLEALPKLAR